MPVGFGKIARARIVPDLESMTLSTKSILPLCLKLDSSAKRTMTGFGATREEVLFPARSRRMYFKKSASVPIMIKWIGSRDINVLAHEAPRVAGRGGERFIAGQADAIERDNLVVQRETRHHPG